VTADTGISEASGLLFCRQTKLGGNVCRESAKYLAAAAISGAPAAKRRNRKARHGSAGKTRNQIESRRDGTMAHKYPNILIHLVFSTKERRNLIPDELRPILWKYLAGIGRNHKIPVLAAGGTTNHVLLLIALPSDSTIAKAVQVLKANSSRWIGEHGIAFAWQEGYGAFSVSASHTSAVRDYIERQPEHHARRSYEDEFLTLLRKIGVAFEPEQVFG
jgi:REP-associated tyrosine transposase